MAKRNQSKTPPEWRLQAAAVTELRRLIDKGAPFLMAGDMNAGRRSPRERGIAQVTGMEPGEADLRIYLPGGRLLMVEMKTANGRLSPAQRLRHEALRQLGHTVEVVKADTEQDAAAQVVALVRAWLPVEGANDNALPGAPAKNSAA